jgi:hypothetical protein
VRCIKHRSVQQLARLFTSVVVAGTIGGTGAEGGAPPGTSYR